MPFISPSDIIGALLAAVAGVVVALFTAYLSDRHEAAEQRHLLRNARALLAFEVRSNRDALGAFWLVVQGLGVAANGDNGDGEGTPPAEGSVEQLGVMYANGLIAHTLPTWSTIRWHRLDAWTIGALSSTEVASLDEVYRALQDVSDLYGRVATLSHDDEQRLQANMGGRFWNLDLARERLPLYQRLVAAVELVLDRPDPLPGAIGPEK